MILPLIFFLSLFQGAFLSLNLVLVVFTVWAAFAYGWGENPDKIGRKIFLVAFFTGIFLDLSSVSVLGYQALLFLILAALFLAYARRFDPTRPWFIAGFVFLANLLTSFLQGKTDSLFGQSLLLAAITLLVGGILHYLMGGFSTIRLKR